MANTAYRALIDWISSLLILRDGITFFLLNLRFPKPICEMNQIKMRKKQALKLINLLCLSSMYCVFCVAYFGEHLRKNNFFNNFNTNNSIASKFSVAICAPSCYLD